MPTLKREHSYSVGSICQLRSRASTTVLASVMHACMVPTGGLASMINDSGKVKLLVRRRTAGIRKTVIVAANHACTQLALGLGICGVLLFDLDSSYGAAWDAIVVTPSP
jgi:hypothetical protein